ncbi:MAG: Gfo/Idh/MocA family oxidoreductase, partial [Kiritimatiellia bacterium]
MIKTCMIGISGYGRMHYDLLCSAEAQGRIEMVGATVINQEEEVERCAELKKRGCRLFTDYQVMLQELSGRAEFCVIPTGTPLHRPMAVAALEAGMHVL